MDGGSRIPARLIRITDIETGVPNPFTFGLFAKQVRCIYRIPAEAGRADLGAVPARKTAFGDFVPMGMVKIVEHELR